VTAAAILFADRAIPSSRDYGDPATTAATKAAGRDPIVWTGIAAEPT